MNMFVGIVTILILLLLLIFVRRPKDSDARKKVRPVERRSPTAKPDSRYHAVSLRALSSGCDAAKAMVGERFLSTEAPNIPLPKCDAPRCKCRYVHYKDRRSTEDRRNPYTQGYGGSDTGSFEKEQRKSGERRDDPADNGF